MKPLAAALLAGALLAAPVAHAAHAVAATTQGATTSFHFNNIPVRSALQLIAEQGQFNLVVSDTVQGNITLRLKDVPWDQALEIILQTRGLDSRRSGNVIWIAPRDELAARARSCAVQRETGTSDHGPVIAWFE